MDALVERLNALCDEQPFHTGWYLKDVRDGATADRHGHLVGPSASTRKIAVMMATLKDIRAGRFSLDQPMTIDAKYQDNKSGCFQYLQPGFTIPLRDFIVMMIIVSDNTCTGAIVDMVGLDRINAFSQSVGMDGTTHRDNIPPAGLPWDHPVDATNTTTPADVGHLLDLILQGASDPAVADQLGVTPELCRYAIDILSWQQLTNRLPYLLPPAARVVHKTGRGVRNFSDAGIIFRGDEPLFILSAYTDQVRPELPDGRAGRGAAHLQIATLCRTCWDYFTA
jgi:beta-lactamase class A